MEEWKEYKLRDFLLIPIRNGLTKPSAIRGQGVKMIGMKEIFAMDYIRSVEMDRVPVTNKEYESSEIMKYDLLFARQSLTLEGAGKCSIVVSVDEPTVFESHLIRLRIDTKKANPFFIYYYYKSSIGKNQIKSLVQQVAAAGIRGKELIELGIKVPHIEKQNQIASILKSLDDKIEVNRKINENLEQQAQGLFKSWFVDFEPFKDGEFVKSELGMIPKGWSIISFKDACINITDGVHNTVKDDMNGNCFLLSCKNIKGGYVLIGDNERRIDENTFEKLRKRTKLQKGDILLSSVGTIGEMVLLNEEPTNYEFQRSVAIIKPNPDKISSHFLYYSMKNQKEIIIHSAHGAVQQCLFISDVASFQTIYPPQNIIQNFTEIAIEIQNKISINTQESRRLATLRDTLLPKLMSGELKVNEVF